MFRFPSERRNIFIGAETIFPLLRKSDETEPAHPATNEIGAPSDLRGWVREDVTMIITAKKPLIAMAALAAAGLVVAIDMAQSRPQISPAAAVAERFPAANELMLAHNVGKAAQTSAPTVNPAKSDRVAPAECVREHWPYLADECLVSSDGAKPRKPTRTISIERRVAAVAANPVR
jgi:hypothetical protein